MLLGVIVIFVGLFERVMGRVYMSLVCLVLLGSIGGSSYCNYQFYVDVYRECLNNGEKIWIALILLGETVTLIAATVFYSLSTCALFTWLSSMAPSNTRRITYQDAVC